MIVKTYEMLVNENRLPYLAAVGETEVMDGDCLTTPEAIHQMIVASFRADELPEEHCWLVVFDCRLHVIGLFELSHGTENQSILSPVPVLQRAFLCGASRIAIVHNHPSGDVIPSRDDREVTRRIKAAAELCGVLFLDHVIVAGAHKNRWYSFHESEEL